MRKLVMLLVVSLTLPAAASISTPETKVRDINFTPTGVVLFHTSTARADVPACAAGHATRWAIDTNTPAGKAQLAGLLTAHSTGKKVSVFGTSTCNVWADTESVNYLLVH